MAEDGEEPKHTVNKFSDALEELSNSAGNEADLDPDDYLAGFVQTGRIEAAAAIWNTFKEGDDHGILDNDEQMRKVSLATTIPIRIASSLTPHRCVNGLVSSKAGSERPRPVYSARPTRSSERILKRPISRAPRPG